MSISKDVILEKQFRRSLRGYDEAEVDNFLDTVAYEVHSLILENTSLKESLAKFKKIESSMVSSLMLAQKSAEDVIQNAHREGQDIVAKANKEATTIRMSVEGEVVNVRQQYERELHNVKKEIESLKSYANTYRSNILGFLEGQKQLFSQTFALNELPPQIEHSLAENEQIASSIYSDLEEAQVTPSAVSEPTATPAGVVSDIISPPETNTATQNTPFDIKDIHSSAPKSEDELKDVLSEIISK